LAYYLVENFQKGLDVRRSKETAPPGSLRVLRNCVINSGGEVEKRKGFVANPTLTAYGQDPTFKGKIVGPMQVPSFTNMAFFRHHVDALPGGDFTAGAGLSSTSYAEYLTEGDGLQSNTFWVHKAYNASYRITSPVLAHNSSVSEFGSADYPGFSASDFAGQIYAVDRSYTTANGWEHMHLQQYMLADTGEPFEFDVDSGGLADRSQQVTLQNKSYTIGDDILYSSAVGDPLDFVSAGAGSLKISSQGNSIGRALAMGIYYGQLAIFGPRGAQFYEVDPDFATNQYLRTVQTSLFAPRSVTGYADGDLIYLSRTGVRSLQARDSSNLAITNDVGSPIDDLIREEIAYDASYREFVIAADVGSGGVELPIPDFYSLAKGIVYPMTGEFWLFLKDKVYVLSRHPSAKVLAWSTYDLPDPVAANLSESAGPVKSGWCADACQIGDTITFRNFADEMYTYGGTTGEEYDTSMAEIVTPFMDMERPGDNKYFTGIDVVCEGKWQIEVCTEPCDDEAAAKWYKVAEVDGRTRGQYRVPFQAQGHQIAVRMTSTSPRRARIAQIGVYFEMGSQK